MRKKSHIALANQLLQSNTNSLLFQHKFSFYWGSILPDCIPSFLTRRHCIQETFPLLQHELSLLMEKYDYKKGITSYFCRHLGIILHHVADYFTYPHNVFFRGNLPAHCKYEKELKFALRSYFKEAKSTLSYNISSTSCTVNSICQKIKETHRTYAETSHTHFTDCYYITEICCYIVDTILSYARERIKEFFPNSYPQSHKVAI